MTNRTDLLAIGLAWEFARRGWRRVLIVSLLLLIPCFWHRRIEAGDLPSHVYNAWLASLIEKGQASGLYLAKQWNNVLVDFALLKIGNLWGWTAAERVVVSVGVLIFFWGAFALIAAITRRAPWFLSPCLAMLTYGWTFNVGFLNYYVSVGLGFFVIAMVWSLLDVSIPAAVGPTVTNQRWSPPRELILAMVLTALVLVAHPQGFLWLVGCVAYMCIWRVLRGRRKLVVPTAAAILLIAVRIYCARHFEMFGVWDSFGPGIYGGNDQIALYSNWYYLLSLAALFFGAACFVADSIRRWRARESWAAPRLPLELYVLVVFGTYVLPDVLRIPLYSGWIGAFALRLTTISAALGLSVFGFMQARKWQTAGFVTVAVIFFTFLYRDTGVLNRMERQAEGLVGSLPRGERVTATIWAPPDSRVPYIVHIVDRACIGRCFSYENYEPASGEFRVRVREGSPIAAADTDEREQMESGEYVVRPEDLPMAQIYQCDASDLTRLCVRQLVAGEENGRLGYRRPEE
jgi:hypothetical protein